MLTIDPGRIGYLAKYLTPKELAEIDRLTAVPTTAPKDYNRYQTDPFAFCVDTFGGYYTDDQIAVMEHVRDYPVTIAESANGIGKTHIAAKIAAWWYKSFKDAYHGAYAQVYTAAAPPERNLIQLLWGEIGGLVQNHPHVFANDRPIHLHISDTKNIRSYITGVTIPATGTPAQREASFSGKHAPFLLFILDEGDAIPHEVYKGIESCLSGGKARLLVMYNPRSDTGPIAKLKASGVKPIKLSAFSHPNVVTGRDIIPGAVTRNKTIHRIHEWTVPATAENEQGVSYGRFDVPTFLVGAEATSEKTGEPYPPLAGGERLIKDPEFSYMVLGVYPGHMAGVIYDTWLDDYDEETGNGRKPSGNVQDEAVYIPGAGPVFWAIDDGYEGKLDFETGTFTPDSHPRVILFIQARRDGRYVIFDEDYQIKEPRPEVQIDTALSRRFPFDPRSATTTNTDDIFPLDTVLHLDHPVMGPGTLTRLDHSSMVIKHGDREPMAIPVSEFYGFCQRAANEGITIASELPRPLFVVIGPGCASLGGLLGKKNLHKRTCMASVEDSIKLVRTAVSPDSNGMRRVLVNKKCKHIRYEMSHYRRNDRLTIIKEYDHGPDAFRYFVWTVRNGVS